MSFQGMKLGRIGMPLPANAPSLRAHAILQPAAPPVLRRNRADFVPELFDNDKIGDCTCVTTANLLRAQAYTRGFAVAITTNQVVGLYSRFGYRPGEPGTDQGAVIADVLNSQLRDGWDIGQQAPAAALWASIEPGDLNGLRNVMCRASGAYLGVRLAQADLGVPGGGVWDTDTPAAQGDPTPGSAGGHALFAWAYDGLGDTDWVWLGTWGTWQPATWRWIASRMDEAHLVTWPQFGGVTGVDAARLEADCGAAA